MTLRPSFAMDTEDASSGLAVGLCDLPDEVLAKVLSFCDRSDVDSLSVINHRFGIIAKTFNVGLRQKPKLDFLPSEILLAIFAFLDKRSLGRVAQVSPEPSPCFQSQMMRSIPVFMTSSDLGESSLQSSCLCRLSLAPFGSRVPVFW